MCFLSDILGRGNINANTAKCTGSTMHCMFAVCVPNPGRRICGECGQWTPYHMPQLLTHPSAGSMVLVGTGTTASVELNLVSSSELYCTGIVSSVSPLQTPQTHTFT